MAGVRFSRRVRSGIWEIGPVNGLLLSELPAGPVPFGALDATGGADETTGFTAEPSGTSPGTSCPRAAVGRTSITERTITPKRSQSKCAQLKRTRLERAQLKRARTAYLGISDRILQSFS